MSGPSRALARPDLIDTTRLAVLSALAAATSAIPLPIVPLALVRYLRGAVVFDVASRHGLSLTVEAREALASVDREPKRGLFGKGAALYLMKVITRRMGPLSVLAPARSSLEVLALGILFERYLRSTRTGPSLRIHAAEARGVREAIDRAVARVMSPDLRPSEAPQLAPPTEDLRDDMTRLLDTLLLTGASVPGYVIRRLEGAFDVVIAESPELLDG